LDLRGVKRELKGDGGGRANGGGELNLASGKLGDYCVLRGYKRTLVKSAEGQSFA